MLPEATNPLQISEVFRFLTEAELSDYLVVAGIVFLFIAVAGNVSGKLEPGRNGRITAGVVGSVLLVTGVLLGIGVGMSTVPAQPSTPTMTPAPMSTPVPTATATSIRTATPGTAPPHPSTETDTPSETPMEGFRVRSVAVTDVVQQTSGYCPNEMLVSGRIEAIGGSGSVSYEFVRSNGETSPLDSVEFAASGTETVSWTFEADAVEQSASGLPGRWVALRIVEPTEQRSAAEEYSVQCRREVASLRTNGRVR